MKKDKKIKIRVSRNIWGSYRGIIGNETVFVCGWDYDAKLWLDETFATGDYVMAKHSEFQPRPIEL